MSDSTSCNCVVDDRRIPAVVLDNVCRFLFRPPKRFLSKYVSRGSVAADLGCGPGFFTVPMAELVGPTGKVHAVDFDARVIQKLLRKAARKVPAGRVSASAASAAEIDFIPDESVDFVLAEGLLCCMKDHAGAMRHIRRILKPSGRAYLSIVKFTNESDPRTVTHAEWTSLLSDMRVIDSGDGLISRWALVGI